MEAFLFLVCEWIEYYQTISGDNISNLAANDQSGGAGNGSNNDSSGNGTSNSAGDSIGNSVDNSAGNIV
jgi:hypothetical protein